MAGMNRTAMLVMLLAVAACRTDRPAGPGDAASAADVQTAETPSGAGSGSGGATPSASRDGMGSTGNNPAQQREYAGTPATTAQKPAPAEGDATCSEDADCAVSRFIPGQCCQDCEERPVLHSELTAQRERCAAELAKCPMRNCAPGSMGRTAACVEGRCVVRARSP